MTVIVLWLQTSGQRVLIIILSALAARYLLVCGYFFMPALRGAPIKIGVKMMFQKTIVTTIVNAPAPTAAHRRSPRPNLPRSAGRLP